MAENPDAKLYLAVTPRERDTMLAALRHWQAWKDSADEGLRDIATCGGEHDALADDEISELCEDINVGPALPWFGVTGRLCGEHEDSFGLYQVATRDEAIEAFKAESREDQEPPEDEDRDEDDDIHGWTVFVNHVIECPVKPVER